MKYGLLTYTENKKFYNIGDYIQSLAAKQFLPNVDEFINREELGDYAGDFVKIILNGWFTHNIHNWIPSKNIDPLFISFHINNTAAPFMLNDKGVAYLKKYEPIGCRDNYTVSILKEKGIYAFFSGCLTLTLDSYRVKEKERGDDIYIVDPLYGYVTWNKVTYNFKSLVRNILNGKAFELGKRKKHLKNIISDELLKSAIYVNQEPPSREISDKEKFELAESLLNKYAKAKLVITSRIHCALPCLALGTPVIFINGFESFVDSSRFDGIIDLFNRVDVDTKTGKWSSNFNLNGKISTNTNITNSDKYKILAERMKSICNDYITENNL